MTPPEARRRAARALLELLVGNPRLARRAVAAAFVGLAKNCGKTTAMTGVLDAARAAGLTPGLVSAGRDGEPSDELLGHPKPRVAVERGDLVVTTRSAIAASRLSWDELAWLDPPCAPLPPPLPGVGPAPGARADGVVCARALSLGHVQLEGCNRLATLGQAVRAMRCHGAGFVAIDGAADRLSASAGGIADRTVLATGLALSSDPDEVARLTLQALGRLGAGRAERSVPLEVLGICRRYTEWAAPAWLGWIRRGESGAATAIEVRPLPPAGGPAGGGSVLGRETTVAAALLEHLLRAGEGPGGAPKPGEDTGGGAGGERSGWALVVPGAVTWRLLAELDTVVRAVSGRVHPARVVVIVSDPWKLVSRPCDAPGIPPATEVLALHDAAVAAVTVNPWSPWDGPEGRRVEPDRLLEAVRAAVQPVPVFDVVAGLSTCPPPDARAPSRG